MPHPAENRHPSAIRFMRESGTWRKQLVEGGNPLTVTGTLYSDLLNAAISEIDWHELADAFLEE